MPELPEVEVVKRDLENLIIGNRIINIKVKNPKIIKYPSVDEFIKTTLNKKITKISRIGKHLIISLEDLILISHLRMEGKYLFINNNTEIKKDIKHMMITFELDNNHSLLYLDTRQFGTMHLYNKDNYLNSKQLSHLGFEPFDKNLTVEYLIEKWKNKRQAIKTCLLNQSYILGIGNIYADEILFSSKVNPLRPAGSLSKKELKNIILSSKIIMSDAISKGGTRIKSFESVNHSKGNYQDFLKVHYRNDKKCKECNSKITKIKVNNRGTYFCEVCQK